MFGEYSCKRNTKENIFSSNEPKAELVGKKEGTDTYLGALPEKETKLNLHKFIVSYRSLLFEFCWRGVDRYSRSAYRW